MVLLIVDYFIMKLYGLSPEFVYYAGIVAILAVLAVEDLLFQTTDDRLIVLGSVFVTPFQWYFDRLPFALLGALAGLCLSGCLFWIGVARQRAIRQHCAAAAASHSGNSEQLGLPFVPALTLAAAIHAVLPGGLTYLVSYLLRWVAAHPGALIILAAICAGALIWVYRRTVQQYGSSAQIDDGLDDSGWGAGDVTVSVLLGLILGWQAFIAVFCVGTLIQISAIFLVHLIFPQLDYTTSIHPGKGTQNFLS